MPKIPPPTAPVINSGPLLFVNASSKLRIMRIEAMKSLGFNEDGVKINDQTPISNTFIEASKEFEQLKIIIISKLEEYIINQINC